MSKSEIYQEIVFDELTLDDEMEKRSTEIKNINADIEDLQKINCLLNDMISSQQELVDKIEIKCEVTHDNTTEAYKELVQTEKIKTTNTKLKLGLVGLTGLILNAPVAIICGLGTGIITTIASIGLGSIVTIIF